MTRFVLLLKVAPIQQAASYFSCSSEISKTTLMRNYYVVAMHTHLLVIIRVLISRCSRLLLKLKTIQLFFSCSLFFLLLLLLLSAFSSPINLSVNKRARALSSSSEVVCRPLLVGSAIYHLTAHRDVFYHLFLSLYTCCNICAF